MSLLSWLNPNNNNKNQTPPVPVSFEMPTVESVESFTAVFTPSTGAGSVQLWLSTDSAYVTQTDLVGKTVREIYQQNFPGKRVPASYVVLDGTTNTSRTVEATYVIQPNDNIKTVKSTSDAASLA